MVFMDKIGGIFAVAGIFGYLALTTTYLGTKKIKKNKKKIDYIYKGMGVSIGMLVLGIIAASLG